jgi:predicted Zn-dependent peptidase
MNDIPLFMKEKNNIRLLIFIVFTLSFFIASPSYVLSYDLSKRVSAFTMKNGMRVLMLERHISPTVSFYIRHRVGALDDEEGKTGIAHLLEHMLFKGTKTIGTKNFVEEEKILKKIRATGNRLDLEMVKGVQADEKKITQLKEDLNKLQTIHKTWIVENELDRIYTENGAVGMNASTGHELTTYHVSLPANKIELWARIEADRMSNPVFRQFYHERNVVMEERKQRTESDPDGKLFENFLATAFMTHQYRRPVIGWSSDISLLTIDDATSFFERYYTPNNTVVAVVGDFDSSMMRKIIEKYFAHIPSRGLSRLRFSQEPIQAGEKRIEVDFDANPQLIIGYHKPNLPAFDDYVFDIISSILANGRTSRLYKTLVSEKQVAESIQTSNGIPGSRFPNLFVIFGAPRHPHSNEELEKLIYLELEKLKTAPVPEKELEKMKNQLKADFIRTLDSNEGLADNLSYFEALTGDFQYMIHHIEVIEKITPQDIMRVARKYLHKENRTVAQLINKNLKK